ncbi:uncharacterized protein SOCE26_063990 [Sorangium cellulosum]|uniref:Secreted protein n=1 Tax=Sorangium cellulosum TaxID=56 RepID=A0A2L0F0D2_SORCE|nr:hypothetical protein [Sorangium cellulosum]AUX44929.1 uncharacterized protein SOCE26_063990 [Sorangium cellulosum]
MKLVSKAIATLVLTLPSILLAADAAAEDRAQSRVCGRISLGSPPRTTVVRENVAVDYLVPIRVTRLSVVAGCTVFVDGSQYDGGSSGRLYSLNTMAGGYNCSCR